jgi:hypothetical protein
MLNPYDGCHTCPAASAPRLLPQGDKTLYRLSLTSSGNTPPPTGVIAWVH